LFRINLPKAHFDSPSGIKIEGNWGEKQILGSSIGQKKRKRVTICLVDCKKMYGDNSDPRRITFHNNLPNFV
jgi:hypothetical protein